MKSNALSIVAILVTSAYLGYSQVDAPLSGSALPSIVRRGVLPKSRAGKLAESQLMRHQEEAREVGGHVFKEVDPQFHHNTEQLRLDLEKLMAYRRQLSFLARDASPQERQRLHTIQRELRAAYIQHSIAVTRANLATLKPWTH